MFFIFTKKYLLYEHTIYIFTISKLYLVKMFKYFKKMYSAKFSDDSVTSHPIFAGFKPSKISHLEHWFQEQSRPAGTDFTISNPDNALFAIVKSGVIQVHEKLCKGKMENIFSVGRGQSFGEHNLFDPDFSILACRVIEDAELLILRHKEFQEMTHKNLHTVNRFYMNLSNIISDRLVELDNEYITLYCNHIIGAEGNQQK